MRYDIRLTPEGQNHSDAADPLVCPGSVLAHCCLRRAFKQGDTAGYHAAQGCQLRAFGPRAPDQGICGPFISDLTAVLPENVKNAALIVEYDLFISSESGVKANSSSFNIGLNGFVDKNQNFPGHCFIN